MNPEEFSRTIYLGDRACKSILIDGWNERVSIQVDEISRIRSVSGNWEFYNDENIVDGFIVFTGVESISFDPPGLIPNDYITSSQVKPIREQKNKHRQRAYSFEISIGSVNRETVLGEVSVHIVARGIHLADPNRPNVEINE